MPNELAATYIGPFMEEGVQMHEFRLYDGTKIALEVPALTVALETAPQMAVETAERIGA